MHRAEESIEDLFREKLMRYHELAQMLKEEKKWIVRADVDAIWRMSEKKQALAAEIEQVRRRILDMADSVPIAHGMTLQNFQTFRLMSLLPADLKKRLADVQSSLMTLKKDNRRHIESNLSMISELIMILTGREKPCEGYGSKAHASKPGAPMLFRREA